MKRHRASLYFDALLFHLILKKCNNFLRILPKIYKHNQLLAGSLPCILDMDLFTLALTDKISNL